MENSPNILKGGIAIDDRGVLSYLNVAPLEKVCRLYAIENFSLHTIRAFHGHMVEEKGVLVVSGSAIVVIAKMTGDFSQPMTCDRLQALRLEDPKRYVLSERSPQLLVVPAGYANGFRALEPNTKILFFSTTTIQQAATDDYRFPADYFGNKIWEVANR